VAGRGTDKSKFTERVVAMLILSAFITHIYCYWFYLNSGKGLEIRGKHLYYLSLYGALSITGVAVQIVSTSALLSGVMGVCVAASNSFILIEFMGNPEYWSTTELWIFISTVFVSFLSSIVLNELKKNINDGVNNFE
jgi:glycerol-3-phosphate acyltransferase PlsY